MPKERFYARADVEAMLRKRSCGVGIETSNHDLQSIRSFSKWLTRKKRIPADELIDLQPLNADTDRKPQAASLAESETSSVVFRRTSRQPRRVRRALG